MTERGSVPHQRRESVRARVRVPVTLSIDGERLRGTTIDISEGGAGCSFPAGGSPPAIGSPAELALQLDDVRVWVPGVVIDVVVRRDWFLIVRFVDPAERDQDLIRNHVFTVLRRERARGFR